MSSARYLGNAAQCDASRRHAFGVIASMLAAALLALALPVDELEAETRPQKTKKPPKLVPRKVDSLYANENDPESLLLPHDTPGSDHGSVGLFKQQVGGAANSTANWGQTAPKIRIMPRPAR